MLTMKQNQKYFPLVDGRGKLAQPVPHRVEHGDPAPAPHRARQRAGAAGAARRREVLLRPGPARDAGVARARDSRRWCFTTSSAASSSASTGSSASRAIVAATLGEDETATRRAARLCKADLLTGMVGEFPELQGIMGTYYARHDGEPEAVAGAIEAHYRPRFAGDALPETRIGALRRARRQARSRSPACSGSASNRPATRIRSGCAAQALGLIRILVEGDLPLSLVELVGEAFAVYPRGLLTDAHADVQMFVLERMRSYLRDAGYSANEIESVLSSSPRASIWSSATARRRARVRQLPEAESLAAANKRVGEHPAAGRRQGGVLPEHRGRAVQGGPGARAASRRSAPRPATPRRASSRATSPAT